MRRRRIYIKAPLYPARPKTTQRDYDPPPAPTPGICQAQGQRSEGPARPPHLPINGVVWLGPGYRNHGPIRAKEPPGGVRAGNPSRSKGGPKTAAGPASFCEGATRRLESYLHRAPPAALPRL